jgi:diguanylate cyclase (GGDEF)-like protein
MLARLGTLAVIALVVLGAALGGALVPIDNGLRDIRFGAAPHAVSGNVVFVDIDSRSLQAIGVWPWPRRTHAQILDALMQLGAGDVFFDIDFSAASNAADDEAFAAALERAGGFAYLSGFSQLSSNGPLGGTNVPLPLFRSLADTVSVNIGVDAQGVVRSYPMSRQLDGVEVPSLAVVLARATPRAGTSFNIDFGIDPRGIDRISATDLLNGRIDAARVRGKQVVVGASAVELRDIFFVPRFEPLPGAMVQILAAETLMQGRALAPLAWFPAAAVALVLLVAAFFARRASLALSLGAILLGFVLVEGVAFLLHAGLALQADTGAVWLGLFLLAIAALWREMLQKRRQQKLAELERDGTLRILNQVIADNAEGIVVVDATGTVIAASDLAETLLPSGLVGTNIAQVLPTGLREAVADALAGRAATPGTREHLLQTADGPRQIEYSATLSQLDPNVGGAAGDRRIVCLTFRDVTERRALEVELEHRASHDLLTDVLSRTGLLDCMGTLLRTGPDLSVLVVNPGRFQSVNATLGHSLGDLLLRELARRLDACGADAVGRLGGDSFVLVYARRFEADAREALFRRILESVTRPYVLGDSHQATVPASLGFTDTSLSAAVAETLLSHADLALVVAKQRVGSHAAIFDPRLDEEINQKLNLETALRHALARGELEALYQPQVDLGTGRVTGAESLLRWHHPVLGDVLPGQFIRLAEETGLIAEIGRWVLNSACRDAATWPGGSTVAVNISPVQFEISDVVAEVKAALAASGLSAERLEVEITEGVFIEDAASTSEQLEAIRALGVKVALDDFGTGYSSLGYLDRLPVDKIKIDQSFTRGLSQGGAAEATIHAVLLLARSLNKLVIAEGVETEAQRRELWKLGCTAGQGYLFGRAQTASAVGTLFAEPMLLPLAV